MKKIVLTFLCLFLINESFSQTAKWDSVGRPGLYAGRVGQFKSFPNSRKDIIFLGNSITAYGNWDELLGLKHVKNRGIPGDNTYGILDRLDEVIEGKPAKVFVLVGINDIAKNFPDSVIIRNYERIIRRIKLGSPTTQIYFHTLLPVNNTFTPPLPHFNKDEHILNVNKELKKLAEKEKIGLVDLYPLFLDANNRLDKDYCFDGLHLNEKGYIAWAELLKKGNYLKK